jgi:ABC-type antimicrobial peptide transport system permease subunit
MPALRIAAVWKPSRRGCQSRQNKLRTALTLVGIIVGVTAVIAVVTIIKVRSDRRQHSSIHGSTVFTISKRPRVITSREDFISTINARTLVKKTPMPSFAYALSVGAWE